MSRFETIRDFKILRRGRRQVRLETMQSNCIV